MFSDVRAIAMKPLLLVLDEASSALDPRPEREILNTVRTISREATVIAISQTPSSVAAMSSNDKQPFAALRWQIKHYCNRNRANQPSIS